MTHEEHHTAKIAKFLGFAVEMKREVATATPELKKKLNTPTQCLRFDELKFASDYNWLMTAVEKIEKCEEAIYENKNCKAKWTVRIEYTNCAICLHEYGEFSKIVREFNYSAETKLEAMFISIARFADYWNELQKTKAK